MKTTTHLFQRFLLLAAMFALAACAPTRKLNSVPQELVGKAQIPGMPQVRTWGDGVDDFFIDSLANSLHQEMAYYAAHPNEEPPKTADILALSGGGDHGAFGAGLLNGWTAAGDRPQFKLVTGISSGALIAPMAFIGVKYDAALRDAYTTISSDDVLSFRGFLAVLNRDGLADTDPLKELICKWVDDDAMKLIAAEHAKGRRLLVATVNMEAQRPVIWDMGAIASSGHPEAPDLFRSIMLASASIPGAFEPQYIQVQAGGKKYEEMHVDGGTASQVFLWGAGVNVAELAKRAGIDRPRRTIRLFIVRNARFAPEYKKLNATVMGIAGRAVATLIKTQSIGDIFRLYTVAQRNNMEFNLASIPESFDAEPGKPFEPEFMNALFQFGFEQGKKGYKWRKTPPYMDDAPAN